MVVTYYFNEAEVNGKRLVSERLYYALARALAKEFNIVLVESVKDIMAQSYITIKDLK